MAFPKQITWILRSFDLNSVLTRQTSEKVAFKSGFDNLLECFLDPEYFCPNHQRFARKISKLSVTGRALRFVYRDYSSSCETLLKQSGHQTLLNQRLAKILTTVYKVVNRQGVSESLYDLVELKGK